MDANNFNESFIRQLFQANPQSRGLNSNRVLSFELLQLASTTLPELVTLNIVYPSNVPTNQIVHFENVTNFVVRIESNVDVLADFPITFRQLNSLEIITSSFAQVPIDLIVKMNSLKSLSLPVTRFEDFVIFTNILNKLPNLEEVKLNWTNGISHGETLDLINRKGKLTKITFNVWTRLSQGDLLSIIPNDWQVVRTDKVDILTHSLYEVAIERKRNPHKRMFEVFF